MAVFSGAVKKISGKDGSAPLEKIGPYAYRVAPQKWHTVFMAITLSTLNHFHNFWHMYTIGNLQLDGA